ncbi:MAG: peptidase [Armatimonadota bacterium]|nr:peptidase [bacterium]
MPQLQERKPAIGEKQFRELSNVEFRAVDGQDRTFELSFSSETPVSRWWGNEILSHDSNAPKLDRLNDGGVLLYNHDTKIQSVLGPVIKAWLDESTRKCRAVVRFDTDEDAEKVFRKVDSGTLRNVSFAYINNSIMEVKAGQKSPDGRFDGPCDIVTSWTAYEISITPVPADNNVGLGRNLETSAGDDPADESTRAAAAAQKTSAEAREAKMDPDELTPGADPTQTGARQQTLEVQPTPAPAGAATAANDEATRQAVEAETRRASEITLLCSEFGMDARSFIDSQSSVDEVRKAILGEMTKRNPPIGSAPRVDVTNEQSDKFRVAGSHALLLRSGATPAQFRSAGIETVDPVASELRHMSLRDLMVEDARLRGHADAARWDMPRLMRDVFTPDSAFVSILDNTVGHSMIMGHEAAQTTFQIWTRPGSLPNLKTTPGFRMSEAGEPKAIGQNGEFEWDEMTDEGINRKLNTYGIGWGLTEDAIINDDLDIITRMPLQYAIACRRKINGDVYAVLNLNPAIFDGKQLFCEDHGNLAGSGGAPTVVTLSAGRKAMRAQKGLRNLQALNIKPRFIIVGTDIETAVEQLIASLADPAGTHAGVVNPAFVRDLTPICDGEITDTNSWHLAADQYAYDTIGVDYLNGNEAPRIETRVSFRTLGMEWRLSHRWGITVYDYRTFYKNAG